MPPISSIVVWGAGWTAGLLLAGGILIVANASHAPWLVYLVAPVVGLVAFGLPVFATARAAGSSHPRREAAPWVVGFAIAAIVLTFDITAESALAAPGTLNINTTETMQRREAHFRAFGKPPEEVFAFLFKVAVLAAFGAVSGLVSALTAMWERRGLRSLGRAAAFGLTTGVTLLASVWVLYVGTYVGALTAGGLGVAGLPLMLVPPFLTGSGVGLVIRSARRAFVGPS